MRELKMTSQSGRELLITKEEQDRNASVTKQSTTDEFKKNAKEMQKLEVGEDGKAKPIIQKEKFKLLNLEAVKKQELSEKMVRYCTSYNQVAIKKKK